MFYHILVEVILQCFQSVKQSFMLINKIITSKKIQSQKFDVHVEVIHTLFRDIKINVR